ncbi:MAG: YbjN domain-containing protein [Hyphomonadaceae bacterium]|nr:YbjN domain-containing protein [Hyphomonadaceae bacterium]
MLKKLVLALVGMLCAVPAMAQEDVVRHFNPLLFEGVLQEAAEDLGETIETGNDQTESGTPIVTATLGDGTRFGLIGTACDSGKCVGANMMMLVTVSPDCIGLARVNQLNVDRAYAKFLIMDGNQVALTRYLIFDHGQNRENLVVEATNYITTVQDLMEEAGACEN